MTVIDTAAIRALAAECKAAGDRARVQLGVGQYMRVLLRAADALTALCDALDEAMRAEKKYQMDQRSYQTMIKDALMKLDSRSLEFAGATELCGRLRAENERLRAEGFVAGLDAALDQVASMRATDGVIDQRTQSLICTSLNITLTKCRAALSPAEGDA